jgi:hypothetical protein
MSSNMELRNDFFEGLKGQGQGQGQGQEGMELPNDTVLRACLG